MQGQTEKMLIIQSWSTRTSWKDVDLTKLKYKDKLNKCDALPQKVHKVFFWHFEVLAEMKTREKDL